MAKNPKTFIYYGKRYRIVFTGKTKKQCLASRAMYATRIVAITKLDNGRYALGVR